MGRPQDAIAILTKAAQSFGRGAMSALLYTSGAAVYCDLGQYRMTRKTCDLALALNAPGTVPHSTSTVSVF